MTFEGSPPNFSWRSSNGISEYLGDISKTPGIANLINNVTRHTSSTSSFGEPSVEGRDGRSESSLRQNGVSLPSSSSRIYRPWSSGIPSLSSRSDITTDSCRSHPVAMVTPNYSYFDLVDTEVLLKSDCTDKFLRNKRGVVKKVSNKNIATVRVHSLDSDIRIPCVSLETVPPELYDNCKVINGPHSSLLGQIGKLVRVKDDDGYVQFLSDKSRIVKIPVDDLARYIKAKTVDSHKLSSSTDSSSSKNRSSTDHELRLSIPLTSVSTQSTIVISPIAPSNSLSSFDRARDSSSSRDVDTPPPTLGSLVVPETNQQLLRQQQEQDDREEASVRQSISYGISPWSVLQNPRLLMPSTSSSFTSAYPRPPRSPTYFPTSPAYNPASPTYSPASPAYNPSTPPYWTSTPLSQSATLQMSSSQHSSLSSLIPPSSLMGFQPMGFLQDQGLLFNNSSTITLPDADVQTDSAYQRRSRGTGQTLSNFRSNHLEQNHSISTPTLFFVSPSDVQQQTARGSHSHSHNGSLQNSHSHESSLQNSSPFQSRPSVIQYPFSVQTPSSSSSSSASSVTHSSLTSSSNKTYFVDSEHTRQLAMRANNFLSLSRGISQEMGDRNASRGATQVLASGGGINGGRVFRATKLGKLSSLSGGVGGVMDTNRVDKAVKSVLDKLVRQQRSYMSGSAGDINSSSSSDVKTSSVHVSLICPLSQKRMNYPCRGSHCKHHQCFDAEAYIRFNIQRMKVKMKQINGRSVQHSSSKRWQCPLCHKNTPCQELYIDKDLLKWIPDVSVTEVELSKDGSWHPVQKKSSKVEVIDLTEDDT